MSLCTLMCLNSFGQGSGCPPLVLPNTTGPILTAGANTPLAAPNYSMYTDCPVGGSIDYTFYFDACNVCEEYDFCITISSSCDILEFANHGFLYTPGQGLTPNVASMCIQGGTSPFNALVNIACDCTVNVSVSLVPRSSELEPNCPEGVGAGFVMQYVE